VQVDFALIVKALVILAVCLLQSPLVRGSLRRRNRTGTAPQPAQTNSATAP
jgi:hypothetical protein